MWPPADICDLPTKREIHWIKGDIERLEGELQDAVEAFEKAKIRVLGLKSALEERRCWIAPIRKLPTEIIADILLRYSEMDDFAPLTFMAVCRLWHQIVAVTPRAWSIVNLENHKDSRLYYEYFATFLTRSHPTLLHLSLPGSAPRHNSIPYFPHKSMRRIQCLRISVQSLQDLAAGPFSTGYGNQSDEDLSFPKLKRLAITGDGNGEPELVVSIINSTAFPALQFLNWLRLPSAKCGDLSPNFPPLQHLSVNIDGSLIWFGLVQSCASTLKALEIRGHRGIRGLNQSPDRSLHLPVLQYLVLDHPHYPSDELPPVKAITPALTLVVVKTDEASKNAVLEFSRGCVTHARIGAHFTLYGYPSIRVLQFPLKRWYTSTGRVADYAAVLKGVASAHPLLEVIEVNVGKKDQIAKLGAITCKIEEGLAEAGVKARVLWSEGWRSSMPGYLNDSCGKGMPAPNDRRMIRT